MMGKVLSATECQRFAAPHICQVATHAAIFSPCQPGEPAMDQSYHAQAKFGPRQCGSHLVLACLACVAFYGAYPHACCASGGRAAACAIRLMAMGWGFVARGSAGVLSCWLMRALCMLAACSMLLAARASTSAWQLAVSAICITPRICHWLSCFC